VDLAPIFADKDTISLLPYSHIRLTTRDEFMRRKDIAFTTVFVLVLLAGSITALSFRKSGLAFGHWSTVSQPNNVLSTETAPSFADGVWINSEPLTVKGLRGHVVVIQFWTFGCINCRNTLPFVKRLHETYGAKGLTIVGVHSPEFDAEKQLDNVRREVAELGIRYPVLVDNNYSTWKAYKVQAWPTMFILDKAGRIRWGRVGEGAYDEAERTIKNLLAEGEGQSGNNTSVKREKAVMTDKVVKTDDEWRKELSPEQYTVLRKAGTERAFTGAYWDNHEKGVYHCAACGLPLFSSETKFDSGTGWPSFYAPLTEGNVIKESDSTLGVIRTEVKCRRCGSHLGHVFDDGPRPPGLRYCMNSLALKFEKE
jgi:peptide-methionine (R)-S-oxide reductase